MAVSKLATISDVSEYLWIYPPLVGGKLDVNSGKIYINRIELKNTSEKKMIPVSWHAKIDILIGIAWCVTIIDTLVLPTIAPGAIAYIGPFEANIPRNFPVSEDEWRLELYIVDPWGNEALLFRTPIWSLV